MKAKCIIENEIVTKGKEYLILGGECLYEGDNIKCISNIYVQIDCGSIALLPSDFFATIELCFDNYSFKDDKKNEFACYPIAYKHFWSMLYEDREGYVDDYLKAKEDLNTAKEILYKEFSLEDIKSRIEEENLDERDFIFKYLSVIMDDRFIDVAINFIKRSMMSDMKYYEVYEIFKYLAFFNKQAICDFFSDYIINDYWENDKINEVVYNYNFDD